jgi:hypothetical protein
MPAQEFKCRICLAESDESPIRHALEKALPSMQWHGGDSSWDKVRVWGEGPDANIRIYRYEGPGPFELTITLKTLEGTDARQAYVALRQEVVLALHGQVWIPLEPQPVSLIRTADGFPGAYEFESDLDLMSIKITLDAATFSHPALSAAWHWEWGWPQEAPLAKHLEGRVPFRTGGKVKWNRNARIVGDKPSYRIEVGHWDDEADCVPTCGQIHETIQNTILPAIGARNVRAAYSVPGS